MFIVECDWPLIRQRLIETWDTVKVLGLLTRPDEAALQLSIKERSLSPRNQPQV